jgi:hypothetical protein
MRYTLIRRSSPYDVWTKRHVMFCKDQMKRGGLTKGKCVLSRGSV